MTRTQKRKTNTAKKTALVFNPSRGLSLGGRSRVRKSTARRNPVKKAAVAKVNPAKRRVHRRRRNPVSSVTGLIVTAVMAGIGVSLFDVAATRVIPQTSSLVRIGVKLGGAYAIRSFGRSVPVLGKYKDEIALVLLTSAAVDGMKLYLLPLITPVLSSVGLIGNGSGQSQLVDPPAGQDGTTSGLWNNSYATGGWDSPNFS